jgi:hypothetical protein
MKNIAWLSLFALVACGGGSSSPGTPPPVTPPPVTPPASNPPKPSVAATQVDRMGRPAVTTALINPFGLAPGKTSGQSKDEYNASATPSTWQASFAAEIQTSLAVFDGIDGVCGNQILAAPTLNANRYANLAAVLADDRLYVRTDKTTCALYLGAELDAVGATTSGDCGGRTPVEDTIKETYSLLLIGRPTGVTDGLPTIGNTGLGAEGDGFPSATTFPFLTIAH